jgi:hypothetical protein
MRVNSQRSNRYADLHPKGFWIRFWFTACVAFALCFLHFRTDTFGVHLAKVSVASIGAGYIVARFGDSAIRGLLWLLWWS